MKIRNIEKATAAQKRLLIWGAKIIERVFPDAECGCPADFGKDIVEFNCGHYDGEAFCMPNEEKLWSLAEDLNHFYPTIHVEVGYYNNNALLPAYLYLNYTNFWNESSFEDGQFGFIVSMACQGKVPPDKKLYTKNAMSSEDIDNARINVEDGFGMEGKLGDDIINFTVEAIDYEECEGDPDDPYWSYYSGPSLWYYGGSYNGRHIEGLASSANLAVGKMLTAICKDALKHDRFVASALTGHLFRWRMYGFCR